MRPCSRADPPRGPGASRAPVGRAPSCGWRRPCARTHPPHTSAPHWPEKPEPRGKEPDTRAPPTGLRPPQGRRGGRRRALGGRPGHRRRRAQRPDHPGGTHSRFVLISRLGTRHDSATVTDALQTMVADLPRAVYSTITWDQGAEMADHAAFTAITGIPVYFADPHSPRSASHQREHRRADPRVLPQGHRLHRRHRRPGPGRPGPAQGPPTRSLERTDPHRDTGHHHQRCNHHLTPPSSNRHSREQNAPLDEEGRGPAAAVADRDADPAPEHLRRPGEKGSFTP